MSSVEKIFVIGLQPGFALSAEAGARLAQSGVILASPRLYETFFVSAGPLCQTAPGPLNGKILSGKIKIIPKVEDTISFLRGFEGRASVLASGDPLFFGIGGVLLSEFPHGEVKIYPAVSSVQLAFAKAGKSWEDAFFISLHGPKKRRWRPEDLPLLASLHPKLAILTGGENRPEGIARFLPEESTVFVLERLGLPDEKMTVTTPQQMKENGRFAEPNLLIVETRVGLIVEAGGGFTGETAEDRDTGGSVDKNRKVRFGLEESEFEHSSGLITKDEVRAVILHKLRLPAEGVLWDIGAGSGSVGIEAKRLSPGLDVYAVERDPERLAEAVENARKFQAGGINMVRGEAPSALEGLPAPDRVFIGGSGGRLADIIKFAAAAIKGGGIMVVSAIALESINEALSFFEKEGVFSRMDAASVAVSRMAPIGRESAGGKNYLKALNPVFVIRGWRS